MTMGLKETMRFLSPQVRDVAAAIAMKCGEPTQAGYDIDGSCDLAYWTRDRAAGRERILRIHVSADGGIEAHLHSADYGISLERAVEIVKAG